MRRRLDLALVERGLAESRHRAQELIRRGKVRVNGIPCTKASAKVSEADGLLVTTPLRYVSRAGEKLEAALEHFGIDVRGARGLDVGASTGGFTDCLLQYGAAEVTAVDVGHGQLHPSLQEDGRVRSLEGLHAKDLSAENAGRDFGVLVVDVSFISVLKVLPYALALCAKEAVAVVLVKPQFECGKQALGKGGIVRDEAARKESLVKVRDFMNGAGHWIVEGTMDCPVEGGDGNREYLLCARRSTVSSSTGTPEGERPAPQS